MGKGSKLENRLAVYSCIFLLAFVLVFSFNLVTEIAGTNTIASPYGVDFGVYYTAGRMVLAGDTHNLYNEAVHHAALEENLNRTLPFYLPWLYPPTFLLVIVPISLLSYPVALVLWLTVTLGLAVFAVYLLVPKHKSLALLACGFPGVIMNLRWGQNGFLNTALIGFGLYFLEGNPVLAGLMFGLLTYKPQLAFFSLLLLFVTKKWKVLLWAIVFTLGGAIVSGFAFGFDSWVNFVQSLTNTTSGLLDQNWKALAVIQPSLFITLRLAGIKDSINYIILGVIGIIVTLAARWVWKHTDRLALKGTVLVLGTLLVIPYFLQYDMMILSIPLTLLIYDYIEYGCNPVESAFLLLLWVLPILDWTLVIPTHVHVCPFILMALMGIVMLRIKRPARAGFALDKTGVR